MKASFFYTIFIPFSRQFLAFYKRKWYNGVMKNPISNARAFKMKKSPLIIGLCIAVILLCIAGMIVGVVNITINGINGFNDILRYPFLLLIEIACIVLVVAMLIKAEYIVDEKNVIAKYGIVKNVFPLSEITSIVLDSDTKKLTLNMENGYFVLNMYEQDNHEFVQAIRQRNPKIDFSFTLTENKE